MALFMLSLCPFDISVGIAAFVIGLGQISSFLSRLLPQHNFIITHIRKSLQFSFSAVKSKYSRFHVYGKLGERILHCYYLLISQIWASCKITGYLSWGSFHCEIPLKSKFGKENIPNGACKQTIFKVKVKICISQ